MPTAVAEAIVAAVDYLYGVDAAITAATVIGEYGTAITIVAAAASAYATRESQRRAESAAKDAYNASLQDRYIMVRGATEPRQMVLGRARVSGPIFFAGSYGANREHLTLMIALAAHEIDAVEKVYFDDFPLIIDGSGNVTGITKKATFSISTATASVTVNDVFTAGSVTAQAVYGTTIVPLGVSWSGTTVMTVNVTGATAGVVGVLEIYYQPNPSPYLNSAVGIGTDAFTSSATSGAFTLSQAPVPGSIVAVHTYGTAQDAVMTNCTTSMAGLVCTVSGMPGISGNLQITYQIATSVSKARVRTYLGAAGQAADAATVTNFPGIWDSAHTATGIAYLVVELDYDQTAFPSGIPNISALVRGAKCYDPRSSTTAWSENPALLMRYAATSPLCGGLDPSLINDPAVIIAANACDTSTGYVINGNTFTRPLYKAGLAAKSNARPQDVLNDLATAMSGKWVFIDGLLRVHAGVYTTPVLTLDETWLHEAQQVHVQPTRARADLFNVVTARFADEQLQYQVAQMARVAPSTYITADGTELPLDIQFNAVNFTGQAQQIAGARLRELRAGPILTCLCNMRAYAVEVFDVIQVTLPRFGYVAKTFEVTDISWTVNGGIQLSMQATDSTVQQVGAAFTAFNPLTATSLPNPWQVFAITSVTAQSGTAQLLRQIDGTILSRILVTWSLVTDPSVLNGGSIEVRFGLANTNPSTWSSISVTGSDTQVFINDVRDGWVYGLQVRAKNPLTAGQWSPLISHTVVGKTAAPVNVAGFIAQVVQSGVLFSWTPNTEVDYDMTELRVGASWAAGIRLFKGNASSWTWLSPAIGAYTVWAAHYDTSGNVSATPVSASVTVTALAGGTVTFTSLGVVGVAGSGQLAPNGDFTKSVGAPGVTPDNFAAYAFGAAPTFTQSLAAGGALAGANCFRLALTSSFSGSSSAVRFGFNALASAISAFGGYQQNANYIISFYARVSSNPSSCTLGQAAWNNTPATQIALANPVLTSSWQRVVLLVNWGGGTVDTAGPYFYLSNGSIGALPNSATLDISCVQIEQGDAPSGFSANAWAAVGGAGRPSDYASTDLHLAITSGAVQITGNSVIGTSGALATFASIDSYLGGAFCSWTVAAPTVTSGVGLNQVIGLSTSTGTAIANIDFGIHASQNGSLYCYENGTATVINSSWSIGDVMAVTYDGTTVRYLQNGIVRRSKLFVTTLPMYLSAQFYLPTNSASNIRFGPQSSNPFQPNSFVAQGTAALSGNIGFKPTGSVAWDSNIYCTDTYAAGCFASCVVTVPSTSNFMLALTAAPTSVGYLTTSYAIYCLAATYAIYEGGSLVATLAAPVAGDTLAITYDGANVRYWINGVLQKVTPAPSGQKLSLSLPIYSPGSVTTHLQYGPLSGINIGSLPVQAEGSALNSDPGCTDAAAWAGWGSNPSTAGAYAIVATTTGAGVTALQLTNSSSGNSLPVPLSPGKTYRLSFWARQVSGTGPIYGRIQMLDGSNTLIAYSVGLEGVTLTGSWVRYSGILLCPATVVRGFVNLIGNYSSTGVTQFQDARLEEVVNTDLLVANAATEVYQDTHDFAGGTTISPPGGGTITARTFTVTPQGAGTCHVVATLGNLNVQPDSGLSLYWSVSIGGGADTVLGACDATTGSNNRQVSNLDASFAVAAGVSLAFKIQGQHLGGVLLTTLVTLYASSLTVTIVKR